MENNNGRSVFYGVIGVATLIVAIIGATFAYFSATANSANNAATAGATVLTLQVDSNRNNLRNEMIPVETNGLIKASVDAQEVTEDTNAAADAAIFPTFPSPGTTDIDPDTEGTQVRERCKDLLGNNICSIYTFTVTNPSDSASQQIYGYLTVQTNEFANLKYSVYKGEAADVTNWYVNENLSASPQIKNPEANPNGNFEIADGGLVHLARPVPSAVAGVSTTIVDGKPENFIPGMTVTLAPKESVTYTILFWIEETAQDQTDTDSKITDLTSGETRGRIFEGGILVNTSGGGSGVTGTLRLA